MKKYPNNTMMGELQQRLLQLRKFPLPAPIVKQKILDLEKMLTIADLQMSEEAATSEICVVTLSQYEGVRCED